MAENGESADSADTSNWTKVYVGNIPPNCRESDLQDLFAQYGPVKRADIVKNFGFVIFLDKSSAETAIENLNDTEFKGVHIQVQLAKSKMRIDGKTENQCYECGEEGHWARECPKRRGRRRPPPRRDPPPREPPRGGRDYYDRPPQRPPPPSYERDYYRGGYDRDAYDRAPPPPPPRGYDPYDRAAPPRRVEYPLSYRDRDPQPYGRRTPPRSDPYGAPSRDPYARPADPYARDAYSRDSYAAPSRDSYAAPSRDPYDAPSRDPYAPSRSSYATSSQSSDPYARSSDPYASYRQPASRNDYYSSQRFGESPAPPPREGVSRSGY